MTPPSFALKVTGAFGDDYSWRLKEGELRYRGAGVFINPFISRLSTSDEQVIQFVEALDLLEVWKWRSDYRPSEAGWEVMDGQSWSFQAELLGKTCHCGGVNAYPSFRDPRAASIDYERFGLLTAALDSVFGITAHVDRAKWMQERSKKDIRPDLG